MFFAHVNKVIYFILGLSTLLIYRILPYDSALVEQFYSGFLFKGVRLVYDFTLGHLPFPMLYVLILTLLYTIIKIFLKWKNRKSEERNIRVRIVGSVFSILNIAGIIIVLFYWMWGFNYKRISFDKKNELTKQEIKEEWLFKELQEVHERLVNLKDGVTVNSRVNIEYESRKSLRNILPRLKYDIAGRVRVRQIRPKGSLLIWSTAGVYLPWVSEGHIDAGLHPLTKPFTLAHEMSHGYGITEESTCNFTAFLACVNSNNITMQYSGWLGYFRYLLSASRRTNKELYDTFISDQLSQDVKSDLNAIYEELNKYPDIMPMLRDKIYNSYLKSHGIAEGTVSYSRMIHLAAGWQVKNGAYLLKDR